MHKTILYYGSTKEIRKPIYHFDKPFNDYGLGFYCTRDKDIAKEWACVDNETNGMVSTYEIDLSDMKILDLTDGGYSVLNWMAILLKNRHFDVTSQIAVEAKEYLIKHYYVDVEQYDVVVGYRADDSYFTFAKDFIKNTISQEQLSKALTLGELGKQTVLISKKAFDKIIFIRSEPVDAKIFYTKKASRDRKAREEYQDCRNRGQVKDELYVIDILRKGSNKND